MKLQTIAAITIIGLVATAPVQAQIINGDFGSGLTNWTSIGDVSIQSGAAFLTTASSLSDDDAPSASGAFNLSAINVVPSSGGLDAFSGLALDALDPNPDSLVFAFEGSALKQTFTVAAGEVLSFEWRLFTNDPIADYAYVVINGVKTDLGLSALAATVSSPFAFESGLNVFSQVFPSAQTVTLSVGVVDVNDFSGTTALSVDNVQVVPEPSALGLGLVAAAGLLARRRQRQAHA